MPRCSAPKANGQPCRAWAVRGTNPPVCAAHGGSRGKIGAPEGNQNAVSHGAYAKGDELPPDDLDKRIEDLAQRIERVGAFIDGSEDLGADQFIRLHQLHASMTSRLGRLKQQQLSVGGGGDEIGQAIRRVLDRLSEEWGVEL
jgi:hypothetical protein